MGALWPFMEFSERFANFRSQTCGELAFAPASLGTPQARSIENVQVQGVKMGGRRGRGAKIEQPTVRRLKLFGVAANLKHYET